MPGFGVGVVCGYRVWRWGVWGWGEGQGLGFRTSSIVPCTNSCAPSVTKLLRTRSPTRGRCCQARVRLTDSCLGSASICATRATRASRALAMVRARVFLYFRGCIGGWVGGGGGVTMWRATSDLLPPLPCRDRWLHKALLGLNVPDLVHAVEHARLVVQDQPFWAVVQLLDGDPLPTKRRPVWVRGCLG